MGAFDIRLLFFQCNRYRMFGLKGLGLFGISIGFDIDSF